ncbi:uncharacterized protein PHALS_00005 [Plasmopara halstedii]|uniref:Uncharacterized protein n=1 Tax=Plasmopara halstedii TaxID=4781 RepID=A0A0P1ASS2_PLAHL|nr:uncharacterized protein PHALS_00005 [Plasmopara halstedii]CEG44245.1 hypothetical protein PHALS_00005 [Plasmopara halstedii]|eukprot:XP_024580614.1 hypothetical protein PHALS_00005 [Plasmopara halstedii]
MLLLQDNWFKNVRWECERCSCNTDNTTSRLDKDIEQSNSQIGAIWWHKWGKDEKIVAAV